MPLPFREPVQAHVRGRNGEPGCLAITSVRDALALLNRRELGGHEQTLPEWLATVDSLVQAVLLPSSDRVEEARQALLRLAQAIAPPCEGEPAPSGRAWGQDLTAVASVTGSACS